MKIKTEHSIKESNIISAALTAYANDIIAVSQNFNATCQAQVESEKKKKAVPPKGDKK